MQASQTFIEASIDRMGKRMEEGDESDVDLIMVAETTGLDPP